MSFNILQAAKQGQHNQIVQYLSSIKDNDSQLKLTLSTLDKDNGKSALHYASENGHVETLKVLLGERQLRNTPD